MFVPTADNNGEPFTEGDFTAFEAFVIERFGGITRLPKTAQGVWVDSGVTYRDRLRIYGVAVRSLTQGDRVGEIVAFAKRHFRQEAIFIRYLGLAEIL